MQPRTHFCKLLKVIATEAEKLLLDWTPPTTCPFFWPKMHSVRKKYLLQGRFKHTECFWPKKMGKSAEGSRRVVISHTQWQLPLKAHKVVLGSTSPMFHRRNRHPHSLIYVWDGNWIFNHHTRTHYLSQMIAVKVHHHILLSLCCCWGHHLSVTYVIPVPVFIAFTLKCACSTGSSLSSWSVFSRVSQYIDKMDANDVYL